MSKLKRFGKNKSHSAIQRLGFVTRVTLALDDAAFHLKSGVGSAFENLHKILIRLSKRRYRSDRDKQAYPQIFVSTGKILFLLKAKSVVVLDRRTCRNIAANEAWIGKHRVERKQPAVRNSYQNAL